MVMNSEWHRGGGGGGTTHGNLQNVNHSMLECVLFNKGGTSRIEAEISLMMSDINGQHCTITRKMEAKLSRYGLLKTGKTFLLFI